MAFDYSKLTFEEPAGGIRIYDISGKLRKHPTKKYRRRKVETIERVYGHHSEGMGRSGYQGVVNSVRYVIDSRNYPGATYHFWMPFHEITDEDGNLVMYRLQPDNIICYHTKGLNVRGVGFCLQGDTTKYGLSDTQEELLEGFVPWAVDEQYKLQSADGLGWHSEAARWGSRYPKASCPGEAAEAWLRAYRDGE